MKLEDAARRFAFERPGYRLVDFMEVALPVYRLTLVASFLEHKPVTALHEFVLRVIHMGVQRDTDIASFLGIGQRQVEAVLARLDSEELLAVSVAGGERHVSLTPAGQKCVQTAMTISPTVGEVVMHFDGLTRRLVPPQAEALWSYRQVEAEGIRELAAKPPRKPSLEEIPIQDARRVSQELSEFRKKGKRDLLALKALEKSIRHFKVGHLLLYAGEDDTDFLVIVDGLASNAHKQAIIKNGGLRRLGIDDATRLQPVSIGAVETLSPAERRELEEGSEQAERILQDAQQGASVGGQAGADGDRGPPSNKQAAEVPTELAVQLGSIRIRYLQTYEHPDYLDNAFRTATSRILLISPWIRRAVLDQERIAQLRRRLDRDCSVYIGWGYQDEDRERSNTMDVVRELARMHNEYKNFYFVDLGNTHEKILIKDSEFAITTSFNWLSFKGDPKRTFRYERGVLNTDKVSVDEEFAALVTRFKDAKATAATPDQLAALQKKFGR
jgi:Mn-dependent DtxR family transcriptional regulator